MIVLLFVAGTSAVATSGFMTQFFEEHNNIAEITETLENMPKSQFLAAVAEAAKESDNSFAAENFMYFASALSDRSDEFSDEELTAVAMNENYSDLMRVLSIQILGQKHGYAFASNELLELLGSSEVSEEIRTNIMVACDFSSDEAKNQLTSIATSSDPEAAFQAIKKLRNTDLEAACEIADNIIANYEAFDETIVRAAILAKSKQLSADNDSADCTSAEIAEYIDFCKGFHNAVTDQVAQDSAIIGIKRLHRPEGITAILQEESFDPIMKAGAVSQNAVVLYQMIESEPSEKEIELVCYAMDICPLSEFAEPLSKIRSNMVQMYSANEDDLVSRIDHALMRIDEEGWSVHELTEYCNESEE